MLAIVQGTEVVGVLRSPRGLHEIHHGLLDRIKPDFATKVRRAS